MDADATADSYRARTPREAATPGEGRKLDESPVDAGPNVGEGPPLDADATADWHRASSSGETASARSIGPYRLLRKLGEGGMGQVWLAQQDKPVQRQVALKLIRVGIYDESVIQRFQSERQSLAIMNHPSIAKVFDAGTTSDGQPFFCNGVR